MQIRHQILALNAKLESHWIGYAVGAHMSGDSALAVNVLRQYEVAQVSEEVCVFICVFVRNACVCFVVPCVSAHMSGDSALAFNDVAQVCVHVCPCVHVCVYDCHIAVAL